MDISAKMVHFLLQCPAYIQIRDKYFSADSIGQQDWSHVRNIPACEDEGKTINLSQFLTIALDTTIRKNNTKNKNKKHCAVFSHVLPFITVGGPVDKSNVLDYEAHSYVCVNNIHVCMYNIH